MNNNQKIIIGMTCVGFIAALAYWLVLSIKWVPLMPGVAAGEANRTARERLLSWGVDYHISEKTGEILVDQKQIVAVRDRLAHQGISLAEEQGFEVFSKPEYGMSEFVQNLNYQRALEVELSRTVGTMERIKSAKVHLTFEKESLFKEKTKEARASVIVEMTDGEVLSKEAVRGIQQIVSTSVPGLVAESVVIVDKRGIPVNVSANKDDQQLSSRSELERQYTNKVLELVSAILPDSHITAAVSIQYNTTKKRTTLEKLIPSSPDGKGFLLRSKSQTEQGSIDPAAPIQKDKKVNQESEYTFSTEKSDISYPDVVIDHISAAIVVQKIPDVSISKDVIELAVIHALGMNPDRGDSVSLVEAAPRASVSQKQEIAGVAPVLSGGTAQEPTFKYLPYALAVALVLFLAIAFLFGLRRGRSGGRYGASDADLEKLSQEIKAWVRS